MKPNPLMGRSTYWVAPVFTFKAQNFMSHAEFLFLFVHISNQMYDFVIEKEKNIIQSKFDSCISELCMV